MDSNHHAPVTRECVSVGGACVPRALLVTVTSQTAAPATALLQAAAADPASTNISEGAFVLFSKERATFYSTAVIGLNLSEIGHEEVKFRMMRVYAFYCF